MDISRNDDGYSFGLSFNEAASLIAEAIAAREIVPSLPGKLRGALALHPSGAEIESGAVPSFTLRITRAQRPASAPDPTADPKPDAEGAGTDL